MTMEPLAMLLAGQEGRPVMNRTGLDAAFDIELEWSSNLGLAQPPRDSAGAGELRPDGVSLFTAVQEQLGLRLEPARAPVPLLIIDSVQPPTGLNDRNSGDARVKPKRVLGASVPRCVVMKKGRTRLSAQPWRRR
jgi:hypothetical protein